jgi:hypothetical protein
LHFDDGILHAVRARRLQEHFSARPGKLVAIRLDKLADLCGDQVSALGQADANAGR